MDDDNKTGMNANESADTEDVLAGLTETAGELDGQGNGGNSDPADDPNDGSTGSLEDLNEGEGEEIDPGDDAGANPPAAGNPDPTGEGEPPQKQVEGKPEPKETEIDFATARRNKKLLEFAEANGFTSIDAMLADHEGLDEETFRQQVESKELTVEEKAALYDKEHGKDKDSLRAEAEKRGHDAVLNELYAAFPSIRETVKDLHKDINEPQRFLELLMKGLTPAEAFRATGNAPGSTAQTPSGKSHLRRDIHSKTSGTTISIPAADMKMYQSIFPNKTPQQIEELYRRTIKHTAK